MFHAVQYIGMRPRAAVYNKILLRLCKRCETENAIDFFAYMVSNGCMPTEFTLKESSLVTDFNLIFSVPRLTSWFWLRF
jgi:pentatricopeptide repeat protein